jgi:hypothetical protein
MVFLSMEPNLEPSEMKSVAGQCQRLYDTMGIGRMQNSEKRTKEPSTEQPTRQERRKKSVLPRHQPQMMKDLLIFGRPKITLVAVLAGLASLKYGGKHRKV